MSANVVALISSVGVGLIAGLFLDVLGFLLCVVLPTLLTLAIAAFFSRELSAWALPIAWIAQQASYMVALHAGRPRAYRIIVDRVRIMIGL